MQTRRTPKVGERLQNLVTWRFVKVGCEGLSHEVASPWSSHMVALCLAGGGTGLGSDRQRFTVSRLQEGVVRVGTSSRKIKKENVVGVSKHAIKDLCCLYYSWIVLSRCGPITGVMVACCVTYHCTH